MKLLLTVSALLLALITMPLLLLLFILFIRYKRGKRAFPKKLVVFILLCFTFIMSIFIWNRYFFTFEQIDRTYEQLGFGPLHSPAKTYIATAFYEPYGGVLGGVNVWVEVEEVATSTTNVIYYADAKSQVRLKWKDDETLTVTNENRSSPIESRTRTLRVKEEIYEEWGAACRSVLLKKTYKTCLTQYGRLR